MSLNLEQYRQQFPGIQNKTYFNFGGQGTIPRPALEAIYQAHEKIQQEGPFSLTINAWIQKEVVLTRKAIATELQVPAETITLTENVTAGCNVALWGIPWQSGDHILLTDCEHPGVIATIQEICRRFQVTYSLCPIQKTLNQGNPTEVIAQHLQPNTRLLVLSHLLWNTGQVLPLQEIITLCHHHSPQSVQVLVDAAQSAGSLPLNLTTLGVDFYAFTGHKWFCGPAGVGALYVSPEVREDLHPTFIGWRSVILDAQGNPQGWQPDGQRYEVATSAYPLYIGLREAIAVHNSWGTSQERYQRICQLSTYLWEKLTRLDRIQCLRTSPPEAGLVSFQCTDGTAHQNLVQNLERQGFLLRTLADLDCIRACVHYFTDPKEIDHLVAVLQEG